MNDIYKKIILEALWRKINSHDDFARLKGRISAAHGAPPPSTSALRETYLNLIKKGEIKPDVVLDKLLVRRAVRTLSGVAVVTVLTKPYPCPGKCIYCPTEAGMPKSYLKNEPAAARAYKLRFDPYKQIVTRLETLTANGHPTDKIELIIKGGTWSAYPRVYREWFVARCFEACNDRITRIKADNADNFYTPPLTKGRRGGIEKAQKKNETAKHRIIGMTIETRPDFINPAEINWLRKLGVTLVELGVQSIYDDVLDKNLRGHNVKQTILATKLLKNAGFKILYQMMPNLLGSNPARDQKMFRELFNNPDFQPDMLKIYPCSLLKSAPLYKYWQNGLYKPYNQKQLISLLKAIKKKIPYYVRIQRITRDIPSASIVAGV
ncbi:MAG: tRNA uridine(34) 5-carboxymethylaminomethyl modification radical SAM/GNAT enzyme Elp3, partial [Patescibacteria group bacterium]